MALGEGGQLRFQAARWPDHPQREVGARDEREGRRVGRGQERDRDRWRRRVQKAEGEANGVAKVLRGRGQHEPVEGRIELDGQGLDADSAALE